MATSIDNGGQTLTFDYNMRANASVFNKLIYKLLPVGLYGDMPVLSIASNSEVTITPFHAVVEDSANELSVKVSTSTNASAVVSPSRPYIVARFTWSNVDDNFVEIVGLSEGEVDSGDAVIGLCVYDGNTLDSFDTSVQNNMNSATEVALEALEESVSGIGDRLTTAEDDIDTLESKVGQSLNTDSAVVFSTINTGQGANKLYDMNQNVTTSSNVTFNSITTDNVAIKHKLFTGNLTTSESITISHGLSVSKIITVGVSIYNSSSSRWDVSLENANGAAVRYNNTTVTVNQVGNSEYDSQPYRILITYKA